MSSSFSSSHLPLPPTGRRSLPRHCLVHHLVLCGSLLLLPLLFTHASAQTAPPSDSAPSAPSLSSSLPSSPSSSSSSFLPPSASTSAAAGFENYLWARIIGGIFSLVAILISSLHIRAHLQHNHDSQLRRYVVRILWMVPLYACVGWMGLMLRRYTQYFDVARDVYESVVIWSFFQFCLVYLGGSVVLNQQLSRRTQIPHTFPFSACMAPWAMDHRFLFHTRLGVTQYVVIKSLMAVITFSLAAADEYHDGAWAMSSAYTYITVVNNFSQGYALYALYLFYHATKTDLDRIRPVAKFLCVKLIIFATYWQSVLISVLALAGRFEGWEGWSGESVGQGLQDFLICGEMMVASFGHIYAFPSREFWTIDGGDEGTRSGSAISKVFDVMTPSDIVSDVRELTRMNKKYQQVHNDSEDWALSQRGTPDSDEEGGEGDDLRDGVAHSAASQSPDAAHPREKRKRKKKKGAANGDHDGQFTPDEAGRSYSLDGIEERMQRVKAELLEKNRARQEAHSHMRASYEHKGEGQREAEDDSVVELTVSVDADGDDEKAAGTAAPSPTHNDGETGSLVQQHDRGDDSGGHH